MEEVNKNAELNDTDKKLHISDVKQRCIDFVEWCMREKYTYYFNGKEWMWGHSRKQEYYTTDELYEKWLNNVA